MTLLQEEISETNLMDFVWWVGLHQKKLVNCTVSHERVFSYRFIEEKYPGKLLPKSISSLQRPMGKYLSVFSLLMLIAVPSLCQQVSIKIIAPKDLKGRRAILLTREKGFGAMVHSLKLTTSEVDLQMSSDLVPDLYELNVSKMKGSLLFFLEPGSEILLDTTDVSRSVVTHSKSNPEWKLFQETIQLPSSRRSGLFTSGEARARKAGNVDSLNYWSGQKVLEHTELLKKTETFIRSHPGSFVSLYLLKNNWYAFENKQLLETLDKSLAHHRTYSALRNKLQK